MSIQIPHDVEVLRFLDKSKTRYQIALHFGDHFQVTRDYMDKLQRLGLVFVVKTEPWHRGEVRHYLITAKGRAILRGFEEAERRE